MNTNAVPSWLGAALALALLLALAVLFFALATACTGAGYVCGAG